MKAKQRDFSWQNPVIRAVVYQAVVVLLLALGAWFLVHTTLSNLHTRHIATGFHFLHDQAGFAIGESTIDYNPSNSYARAIMVGLLNTLKVSALGIIIATILGVIIGIARLSHNILLSTLAAIYIEVMRNIPLIIQLFFWYVVITESLPYARQAINIDNLIFLSNRGLYLPAVRGGSLIWIFVGIVAALVAIYATVRYATSYQARTGNRLPVWLISLGWLVLLPAIALVSSGLDLHLDIPHLAGFNYQGGTALTPELTALLMGLSIYTAAFIAEIVRSGISSIDKGQWEAADSLGLRRRFTFQLIILPLALRVIIPPLTSNYMNLVKNSSLAIAIGYPDLVYVVNTTINQTGQAIEGVLIIMLAYLVVSLSISFVMNWYNKRIALIER